MNSIKCSVARCKQEADSWCECKGTDYVFCVKHLAKHRGHRTVKLNRTLSQTEKEVAMRWMHVANSMETDAKVLYLEKQMNLRKSTHEKIQILLKNLNTQIDTNLKEYSKLEEGLSSLRTLATGFVYSGISLIDYPELSQRVSDTTFYELLKQKGITLSYKTFMQFIALGNDIETKTQALNIAQELANTPEEFSGLSDEFSSLARLSNGAKAKRGLLKRACETCPESIPLKRVQKVDELIQVLIKDRKYSTAFTWIEKQKAFEQQKNLNQQLCDTLQTQAKLLETQGKPKQGLDCYSESATLSRRLKNDINLSLILGKMGDLYVQTRQYREAITVLEELSQLQARLKNQNEIPYTLKKIAEVAKLNGNTQLAIKRIQTACKEFKSLRKTREYAQSFDWLGNYLSDEKLWKEAIEAFKNAVKAWDSLELWPNKAITLKALAHAFFKKKKYSDAIEALNQCKQVYLIANDKANVKNIEGIVREYAYKDQRFLASLNYHEKPNLNANYGLKPKPKPSRRVIQNGYLYPRPETRNTRLSYDDEEDLLNRSFSYRQFDRRDSIESFYSHFTPRNN